MRILVTGGAGFLGSHLCERLLNNNNTVICLDNYFTGSEKNISHLLSDSNFQFINHDVIDPFNFEVDQIYNLACPASPPHYQENPVKTMQTSVIGALNCLNLGKQQNARVLQASTSEVYGDPEVHPQKEDYKGSVNPIGIRACYDEGKRCAETLFFDFNRQYNVDIRVVRIFNTYGPRMLPNDGRVVSNFIVQALRGEDLTIYGDGTQTRSFCFVDELIDALIKMMGNKIHIGPINIGNPDEFTILQLAQLVIKKIGSNSKISMTALPQDDPLQRRPDISAANLNLNWSPKIKLDEGLDKTIDYFKSELS